jgi:hypothetical protein
VARWGLGRRFERASTYDGSNPAGMTAHGYLVKPRRVHASARAFSNGRDPQQTSDVLSILLDRPTPSEGIANCCSGHYDVLNPKHGQPQAFRRRGDETILRPNQKTRRGCKADRRRVHARSVLQQQLAEVVRHRAATSEVPRVIASSPHDLQPIFDTISGSATRLCQATLGD